MRQTADAGPEPQRHRALAWVDDKRETVMEIAPRIPGFHQCAGALDRDRRIGGGLLAGALAFRLFGAMLPLALLLSVVLGFAAGQDPGATESAGEAIGIGPALLDSVSESSKLSAETRWPVALFALIALLWSALLAAKAIRAVHSLAWEGRVGQVPRPLGAALTLLATIAAIATVIAAAGRIRAELGVPGVIIIALLAYACFFGIWLGLSWLLPHGDAHWTALIPGALLFAFGVQVIHLGTTLFIAGKVERASETYGALGVAFTILFWLYIVSRVIVASAMLNSSMHEGRRATTPGA